MMNRNVLLGKLGNKDGFEITDELLEAFAFHFQHLDPAHFIEASALAKIGMHYRMRWDEVIAAYVKTGKKQILPNGATIYSTKNENNPRRLKWKKAIPDGSDVKYCLDSIGITLGMTFNRFIATAKRREAEKKAALERAGYYND